MMLSKEIYLTFNKKKKKKKSNKQKKKIFNIKILIFSFFLTRSTMTAGNMNMPLIFVEEGPGGRQATSRNKAARKKILKNNQPQIELPFPPTITVMDLLIPKNKKCVKSKAPNCFMIYRQNYVRELQNQNLTYPMTDISGIISECWKHEKPHVVEFYKNLAQEANKRHKEMYGNIPVPVRNKKNQIKKEKKLSQKSRQDKKCEPIPQIPDNNFSLDMQNNYDFSLDLSLPSYFSFDSCSSPPFYSNSFAINTFELFDLEHTFNI
jgi:hypothetical protein